VSLYQVNDKVLKTDRRSRYAWTLIRFLSAVYNFHEAATVEAKYRAILGGKASMSGLNEKL